MTRKSLTILLFALATTAVAHADVRFSIRYHDKNIYYPGDRIQLKLTIENPLEGSENTEILLADRPSQSFGFDVRDLRGEPTDTAEGFASSLDIGGAYRLVHLAPGQEMTITVDLNDWVDINQAGQYRITGMFFPRLRSGGFPMFAEASLDLTILPRTETRWQDVLDQSTRQALLDRDLDPWSVVSYILDARRLGRHNRASLYLDLQSMASSLGPGIASQRLEEAILAGAWSDIPGLESPSEDSVLIAQMVYPEESVVQVLAGFAPQGERYEREIRFYLHRPQGYWTVRRIESYSPENLETGVQVDPSTYGSRNLDPRGVVEQFLLSVNRSDWDIALRYIDLTAIVKDLPEYRDLWTTTMSAEEHEAAVTRYRNRLISGTLPPDRRFLNELNLWEIQDVRYGRSEGSVTVSSTSTVQTAAGPLDQNWNYIFRLSFRQETGDWVVTRYDVEEIREVR